ncbi:uncharacterized protein E0L32_005301 [Thyridium curvatum]|uniref:Uncharacterized protein n=1 Tax=Thyridium curvatum TaxID=1093900 RepID=A0A507BB59_9PEZI|nr:uncharacterized protein E0L32_005301 [Thyridium curvatum]TPX14609.1 hypothetical protein E0L32_005301 [Thyridium curvatum]
MNTWRHQHIYSTHPTIWVDLMNRSTQDWGVGYLPMNVFATNGSLKNGSADIPADPRAFIIVHAGNGYTSGSPTPQVVFGIVSFIAIVLTILLSWYNWSTMVTPSNHGMLSWITEPGYQLSSTRATHHSARNTVTTGVAAGTSAVDDIEMTANDGLQSTAKFADMGRVGTSARLFQRQIMQYYYEPVVTELELDVKQPGEDVDDDDIEEVITLARRMLKFDNDLWSNRSTLGYREATRHRIAEKREAITKDIKDTVSGWARARWDTDEREQLTNIMDTLYIEEQETIDTRDEGRQRHRLSTARTERMRRWLSQRSRTQ